MRIAIYYTPAPESALARLGAEWLGRDAFSGETTRPPGPLDPYLVEARRYGIHATLRAPFRLRDGQVIDAVNDRLAAFSARPQPVISRVVLAKFGRNYELVPAAPEPGIATLEADVLEAFEPFRAPLLNEEIARRRPERMNARQLTLLHQWGYPFVLDQFRFHVSLAWPMPEGAPDLRHDLESHFAAILDRPLPLDGLGLFVEDEPGAPFRVQAFHPFRPATGPQTATNS